MTVVRQDTFTRANVASGWGTATDGNVWTIQSGDGQSVASNEGLITNSTASTFATLGAALAGADAEGLVRIGAVGSTNTIGVLLRWTDSSNHWLCRYNGAGAIEAMVKVGGTYTHMTPSYTFTPSGSTFYWLRFRVQGTTISFRIWQDGTAEPSTWTEQYTSSSQNVAGAAGLYGFSSGGSEDVDHFSVDDLAASGTAYTQTITDTQSALDARMSQFSRPVTSDRQSGTDSLSATKVVGGAQYTRALSETQSALDGQVRAMTLPLLEGLSARDPLSKLVQLHPLTEGESQTDALTVTDVPQGAGTGISTLQVVNLTEAWYNVSGNPGPGLATRVISMDATSSGWAADIQPAYGGATFSSIFEVDNNVYGIDQTSFSTTTPDGHLHWLEQNGVGGFAGSEDKPFSVIELTPTTTSFRRYFKATWGPDANGFNWNIFTCVYPGDPGFLAYRFDLINSSSSAITLAGSDGLEIALIGGLQQTDGTWVYQNGGYGQLSWTNSTTWPVASSTGNLVSADPDYVYITPTSSGSTVIGQVTAKQKATSAFTPAWANPQLAVLANTDRMKIKLQGDITSFPGNTTSTVYLLHALRRNLQRADAIALAADYISPGTPSGPFTSFSYDERAYVFDASAGSVTTTFDMTGVTKRFKPIPKLTSWNAAATPTLTWGGVPLVAGTDYQWYYDSANRALYLQLYFDIVLSGAGAGQRNNAPLVISGNTVGVSVGSDTTSGLDTAPKTVQKPFVDLFSGSDSLYRQLQRLLGDQTSAQEALTRVWSAHVALSEGISASDTVKKTLRRYLGDAFSALDGLTTAKSGGGTLYSRAIGDTTSANDLLASAALVKLLGDVISTQELLYKALFRPLDDAVSGLETVSSVTRKVFVDMSASLDQQTKATSKQWYDTSSASDALTRTLTRLFVDSFTLQDQQAKQLTRALVELTRQTDRIAAGRVFLLTLLEQTGLLDTPMSTYTRAQWGILAMVTSLVSSALHINVTFTNSHNLTMTFGLLSGDLSMAFSIPR